MKKEYAKDYAIALFDLSLEDNILNETIDELNIITSSCLDNVEFMKILTHPQLSKDKRKEIISDVYKNINKKLLNFIYVLIDNDHLTDLEQIRAELTKLFNEYHKIINVEAYTTVFLTIEQTTNLSRKLELKYRHKIEIDNIIDKTLIGGMRLKINNDLLDFSIKSELTNLKSHILKQT